MVITWVGGLQTEGEVVRPVARFRQLSYYAALRDQVEQWAAAGLRAIAATFLNNMADEPGRPDQRQAVQAP